MASAQANLNTARAALQKVQSGPSATDLQSAQNAVAAAQLAAHKAQADQAMYDGRKAALDRLIASTLIEKAAAATGVSTDKYLADEIAPSLAGGSNSNC